MKARQRLFASRDLYGLTKTDSLFLAAVRENLTFHLEHCPEYARLLNAADFRPQQLEHMADLEKIPPLPTLYLKRHALFSVPRELLLRAGVNRITRGDNMSSGYCGAPHDGEFPLRRYSRVVSLEL